MNAPRLMILSDAAAAPGSPGERRWSLEVLPTVLEAAAPGSIVVQLRHREANLHDRLLLGRSLRRLTAEHRQMLVVNDRADLARALGADGLHLPERGMSVTQARSLLGPDAWVSRAWHGDPIDADAPPDALVLSPVVAPRKGRPALGRAGVEAILRRERRALEGVFPEVFALGGVTAEAAPECLDAGLSGVAVIGAAATLRGALALLDALGVLRSTAQR